MLVHWMKGVTPQQYVIRIHFIVNEYGWPVRQSKVEYAIPLTVISETTCRFVVVQRWILVSKYSYAWFKWRLSGRWRYNVWSTGVWVKKSKVEQRHLKQHNNEASAKTARSTVGWFYHSTFPRPPSPWQKPSYYFLLGYSSFCISVENRKERWRYKTSHHFTSYLYKSCMHLQLGLGRAVIFTSLWPGTPCDGLYGEAPPKGVPFSGFRYMKG